MSQTLQLLHSLGFSINYQKSHLQQYLGATIDTSVAKAYPNPARIANMQTLIQKFQPQHSLPAQVFMQLIGMMASCIFIVPHSRLQMRPLQECLARQWNQAQGQLKDLVLVDSRSYNSLQWWNPQNLSKGRLFQEPVPQVVLTADTSLTGWGAHLLQYTVQGLWTIKQKTLHINHLELLAICLALKAFQKYLYNKAVLIRTDNMTTMYYIQKQGGTHSPQLSHLAQSIWRWAIPKNIFVLAEHLPGKDNQIADLLSRHSQQLHEWEIHPQALQPFFQEWGHPEIDLFATNENSKCHYFAARVPHPLSQRNAIWMNWSGRFAYAFPPAPLIPLVARKLRQQSLTMILVAPTWARQPWFTTFLELSVVPHQRMRLSPHLLTQNHGEIRPPDPNQMNLAIWLLKS
ncbi:uncharacterized protein LOC144824504 [Lissotriton helveticus]